ncbi:hypothetical protein [Xylocopilactobacillus apicola]|uniref:Uncharacterized protein n=1 Tax=Xylocopilactobacillus apicola TaxID=2932184 RepID=A0AAU9DDL0_9LACO|nr:hypothetical protein [Xylocopilactobacillus apicola]BDR59680.1 hypothetical protein XA3_21210 [Xylocopilactobacillus apicola]
MAQNKKEIRFDRSELAAYAAMAAKNIDLDVATAFRLANEINRLVDASQLNPDFREILLNQAQKWFDDNTPKSE